MSTDLPADTSKWPHGTSVGYGKHKCRCEACRSWSVESQRLRRRAKGARTRVEQIVDAKNRALAGLQAFLDDPADPRHGTVTGYNKGCRCDRCRTEQARRHNANSHAAKDRPTPDHVHGTVNGYVYWFCRCDRCYAAQSEANRLGRLRRKAAKQANA